MTLTFQARRNEMCWFTFNYIHFCLPSLVGNGSVIVALYPRPKRDFRACESLRYVWHPPSLFKSALLSNLSRAFAEKSVFGGKLLRCCAVGFASGCSASIWPWAKQAHCTEKKVIKHTFFFTQWNRMCHFLVFHL